MHYHTPVTPSIQSIPTARLISGFLRGKLGQRANEINIGIAWMVFLWDASCTTNSLWQCDAIWRHGPWLTLVQIMACCLTAPRHYLNHFRLTAGRVQHYSPECQKINLELLMKVITQTHLNITHLKSNAYFPRASVLKMLLPSAN